MNLLKLYRGADMIGTLTDIAQDGPEFLAALELTPAAANHKELLDYIMSTDKGDEDPPEALKLFEDWFMETEDGIMRDIFAPGIHPGAKWLRWRWKNRFDL
jgi:hypothetical protein